MTVSLQIVEVALVNLTIGGNLVLVIGVVVAVPFGCLLFFRSSCHLGDTILLK